jgi:mRNA interferase RelE/StbE
LGWKVEFIPTAEQQLRRLDRTAAISIARYLQETVANGGDPRQRGKGQTATLAGLWRYRVGDYRVICQIEAARLVVLVVRISHRSEIYR